MQKLSTILRFKLGASLPKMQVVGFHDCQDGKGGHHSGLPLQVGHSEITDLACRLQILKGYRYSDF